MESNPPQVNGVLTACTSEDISLTCSHNNVITAGTQWSISPPVNCTATVTHESPNNPTCGAFVVQDITRPANAMVINSTAVATADVSMAGSVVECVGGNSVSNFIVGNITLCIVGELFNTYTVLCT